VADGDDGAEAMVGRVVPVASEAAEAFRKERYRLIENLQTAAEWPGPVPADPALAAPLAAGETLHGVLIVGYEPGQGAHDDAALLSSFAGQAALALERVRAQEEREQLVVLEDRERIARDLHDVVIQRLFATGMQLQGAAVHAVPGMATRINAAVDDLDATIRDIRRAIFELRTPAGSSLRTELRSAIEAATGALGFRPVLDVTGPVDSAVPDDIVPELLAVVREALSNAARHARATMVRVSVRADGDEVFLCIEVDGVGIDPDLARGGVVNMGERARDLGGTFQIGPGPSGGTVVTWRVPLG
jgi:signal transduction histidine kinase